MLIRCERGVYQVAQSVGMAAYKFPKRGIRGVALGHSRQMRLRGLVPTPFNEGVQEREIFVCGQPLDRHGLPDKIAALWVRPPADAFRRGLAPPVLHVPSRCRAEASGTKARCCGALPRLSPSWAASRRSLLIFSPMNASRCRALSSS